MHKSAVARHSGAPLATSGLTVAARRFAGVLIRAGLRFAGAIAVELRARRDMRHLTEMSDHLLKDIGLRRADIAGAVRHGRD